MDARTRLGSKTWWLLYFVDIEGKPVQEYWHDMKFWWPHNEAIIATLLAYEHTQDPLFAEWHARIHDWSRKHFFDEFHGEWFGYLHRDGSLSQSAKGNLWKSFFHYPRMLWHANTFLRMVHCPKSASFQRFDLDDG